MTREKSSEDKKNQSRDSKGFIEEVKSFANIEGKQMVGFVRNKFREAMEDEDADVEETVTKKSSNTESLVILPSELKDALKAASKSTGMSVVELIHECVTRSLEEVLHEQDNKKTEALSKLKLLKKEEGGF
jgi:predicted DNA-binding protein